MVIQLRAIGDVILTTPVFSVLKRNFPTANIHFLTGQGMHELVEGLPEIGALFTLPESGNLLQNLQFYFNIRKQNYDLVIDYQCTPGTAFITWLSGAAFRIGWKMERRQWAYNLYSDANIERVYVSYQKCRALKLIGVHEESRMLRVKIAENQYPIVDNFFREHNISRENLLVNITPKGKRPARQWFPEKIAELADFLIDNYNAVVFYNRAPGEEKYASEVAALSKNLIHILPLWPLSTFAAFLDCIDLHISYDNGPKHLAMAVGTPTISLFATDFPDLWNPMDKPDHPFILAPVPCRFCRLKKCPIMICMKKVDVSDVVAKIQEIPKIQSKIS
ncbi:MAG: glycosyltransferase family 9 protein [Calditrichaeota bacterium]|nr:glycosyltransferase family 9 protein [Calditrichota bacterium]